MSLRPGECPGLVLGVRSSLSLHLHGAQPYKININYMRKQIKGLNTNSRSIKYYLVYYFGLLVVAHGRVVTSSRQITEVKQRWARLVLGWVTAGARVTLSAMCRGVGQAFHIMPPLSTQQWWVPGGTNNGELWMAIAAENALNFPQRRWDRTRESSNTRGVNCEVCWTRWDIRL